MRRIMLPFLLLAAVAPAATAQGPGTPAPGARIFSWAGDDGDRAMLGVATASSGTRDTLGLLIESVSNGSPADKAGLEEGNRIASINGVNLKLSREDAGEPDMSGTMTSRLSREMRKVHAGDDVTLEVWTDGRYRTVKVKTVAANDLIPIPARVSRADADDRPVLGISLGPSGSRRDTLGLFVSSVNQDGPADRAGVVEGDRIAAINGVDLRVPKEDTGDWGAANSRVQRLQREVRKFKPGQTVELAVVEDGRTRSVKVTLGRADDIHVGGLEESLREIGPRVRLELDRQLPAAMDEVRKSMERLRERMPMIRSRVLRGVII